MWDTYNECIQLLIEQVNSYHNNVKFTAEVPQPEITFLDTTAYKGERFENENIDVRTHFNLLKPFSTLTYQAVPHQALKKASSKEEPSDSLEQTLQQELLSQTT